MKMFLSWFTAFVVVGLSTGNGSAAAESASASSSVPAIVKNGTIGYVMTERHWAVYQTPEGKVECPKGFNDGPREQFKQLFSDDGTQRTVLDTQLKREGDVWFPTTKPEPFVFKEAGGEISFGLNLDGKIGANDFTSPEGEKGIDNQLYRAIGCISNYRAPDGLIYFLENDHIRRYNQNRFMIEIIGVDSLLNDDDVTVKSYRGLDDLLKDTTGSGFIPQGTQHVDARWGKFSQAVWKGKIIDGVLVTEPGDVILPPSTGYDSSSSLHKFKGLRFKLRLTPEHAEGLMAGYADVEQFYRQLITSWSTHSQSLGHSASGSLYRALRRLADGYPDPNTGEMTAISSALNVKFTQVYIEHPPSESVENRPVQRGSGSTR